jgi:hypothetical protein
VYVWFFGRIYCIRVRYSENCKRVRNIENCDVYLLRQQLVVYIVFVYAKLNCTGYLFEIQQVDSIVSANLDAVAIECILPNNSVVGLVAINLQAIITYLNYRN